MNSMERTLRKQYIAQTLIYDTGLILNFVLSMVDVFAGRMSPGRFIMMQTLFLQFGATIYWMGWYMREFAKTTVDVRDLFHMLKTEPIIEEKADAKDFEYKSGGIQFKNLSYAHYIAEEQPTDLEHPSPAEHDSFKIKKKQLMDGFDLNIEPGTTNAIVGPSGFGKTTLFNCIAGLESHEGEIKYATANLKNTIGFLETNPEFLSKITGKEYLQLVSNARNIKDVNFDTQNKNRIIFGYDFVQINTF